METKLRNRLLSVALLLLFALPASAQSITFTTTKNVGEKITLTIKATNGPVTATGLTEKIVADASEQTYTLTSQTITLDGPIEVFKCDRNKLTNLDIAKGADMIRLECQDNNLTSFTFANCPKLEVLWCFNNKLSALDVSDCLNLKDLLCSGNNITSLDVSKCLGLKKLSCESNKITTLDVSKHDNLTHLWCQENKLTSLNVAECPNLVRVSCQGNLLSCTQMENLAIALPQRGQSDYAAFECILETEKMAMNGSGNVILKSSVDIAKSKKWSVYCVATYSWPPREEYAGRDGSCTDYQPKANIILTTEKAVGEKIRMTIKANGEVTATGLKEAIKLGKTTTYTLTAQKIELTGDILELTCKSNKMSEIALNNCAHLTSLKCGGNELTALDLSWCPALSYVDCQRNKIATLTIPKNSSVSYLDCQQNKLTEIDLANCTALNALDCNTNELAFLDFSKNKELTGLQCYNNKLSLINLAECAKLEFLACGINSLSLLDITGCPNISKLFCQRNSLTSLDLSSASKLEELDCGENNLSTLDVSACINLKELHCYKNQLSSIDISKNTELLVISVFSNQLTALGLLNNANLMQILCFDNKISTLDVSPCSKLEWLWCFSNQMTALDISHCDNLVDLKIQNNLLGCSAIESIAEKLPQKTMGITGTFIALTEAEIEAEPGAGNVVTAHAVNLAKEKSWNTYSIDPATEIKTMYEGRDGNCTDNALSFAVTVSENANGRVTVKGAANLEAVPYGTELTVEVAPEAGYELDKLMANEEDITATKRFVVKSNVQVTATFKTDAEAVARKGIALYPNPASSEANLSGVAPRGEVSVYGTDGARLLAITADQSGHAVLRLEGLPEGNYLVTFRDAMGVLTTRQLTIKR